MILEYHKGGLSEDRITVNDVNYCVLSSSNGIPVAAVVVCPGGEKNSNTLFITTADDANFKSVLEGLGLTKRKTVDVTKALS
jgi:hypothetical protein